MHSERERTRTRLILSYFSFMAFRYTEKVDEDHRRMRG